MTEESRRAMGEEAIALALNVGYDSAGNSDWPVLHYGHVLDDAATNECNKPVVSLLIVVCGALRHRRVLGGLKSQVLLPRDEHAAAGGTSHHRVHHGHRHRSPDDQDRQRLVW